MGIEFDKVLDFIFNSDVIGGFINDPIVVGITIVLLIMFLFYWIFYEVYYEDSDISMNRLLFRSGFWSSIIIFPTLFLHYKYMTREFESKNENKILDQTLESASKVIIPQNFKDQPNQIEQTDQTDQKVGGSDHSGGDILEITKDIINEPTLTIFE